MVQYLLKAPEKHNLVILGGRSKDALDKLQTLSPKHVQLVIGDLSDLTLGQKAVDVAISSFGQLDALAINHGTLGEVSRIAECDLDEIRKTFDVNFFAAIACVCLNPSHACSAKNVCCDQTSCLARGKTEPLAH